MNGNSAMGYGTSIVKATHTNWASVFDRTARGLAQG